MVIVQEAFLDNVGASEALLHLPEHMELKQLLCGWVSPMLESRSKRSLTCGGTGRSSMCDGWCSGSLLLLVGVPCGKGSVVRAATQHNADVVPLSQQMRTSQMVSEVVHIYI